MKIAGSGNFAKEKIIQTSFQTLQGDFNSRLWIIISIKKSLCDFHANQVAIYGKFLFINFKGSTRVSHNSPAHIPCHPYALLRKKCENCPRGLINQLKLCPMTNFVFHVQQKGRQEKVQWIKGAQHTAKWERETKLFL